VSEPRYIVAIARDVAVGTRVAPCADLSTATKLAAYLNEGTVPDDDGDGWQLMPIIPDDDPAAADPVVVDTHAPHAALPKD
jgi:hypothetical protein